MARPSSPHTVYPNSSNDHSFTPRREFIRDDRVPSTFAILTLSASSFIRLFGFPQPLISALRRLLLEKDRLAVGFREDIAQNFCEFTLEGKPWASPKSIPSEKLLVDILAVLFQHGYIFLSTLDYGREQDDRVAMAFSKPSLNHAPQSSSPPLPTLHRTSGPSPTPTLPSVRIPFALSFISASTLRVISPPLHSTPAILQAVRGAWPRGVESEKKVGDSTYEFKLKGYKWFQEDTFATDSLRHVLTILASLDSFGFTLQTSISVSNRSKVKDLWIFTGLSSSEPPDSPPGSPDMSKTSLQAVQGGPIPDTGRFIDHRKANSVPGPSQSHLDKAGHSRTATDKGSTAAVTQSSPLASHPSLLRKPAPRAQLPVSVASSNASQEGVPPMSGLANQRLPRTSEELIRANLPSTVGSATDMTGIGTAAHHAMIESSAAPSPAIFYSTSPKPTDVHNPYFPSTTAVPAQSTRSTSPKVTPTAPTRDTPPESVPQSPEPSTTTSITPPAFPSPSATTEQPSRDTIQSTATTSTTPTPPLLGPGAFRDSAFSSNTSQTCEIPITWTGKEPEKDTADSRKLRDPVLPGGWATPVEEKPELDESSNTTSPTDGAADERTDSGDDGFLRPGGEFGPRTKEMTPEQQQVRVNEPKLVQQETERKSHPVLLGEIPRAKLEVKNIGDTKDETPSVKQDRHKSADGWVMVNVAQPYSPSSTRPPSHRKSASEPAMPISTAPPKPTTPPNGNGASHAIGPLGSSMSPAAKAIVMVDALEAQKVKGGSRAASPAVSAKPTDPPSRPSSPQQSSSFRRLFSLNRSGVESPEKQKGKEKADRNRIKRPGAGVAKTKSMAQEEIDEKKRTGKTSRWKRNKVPPEVSKASERAAVD